MDRPEVALRRKKLLQWIALNGTPANEKSLFSQLKGTGSFGEKVARRLEERYRMGERYLDTAEAPPVNNAPPSGNDFMRALSLTVEAPEEVEYLAVYRLADENERKLIDRAVSIVRQRINSGAPSNKQPR